MQKSPAAHSCRSTLGARSEKQALDLCAATGLLSLKLMILLAASIMTAYRNKVSS